MMCFKCENTIFKTCVVPVLQLYRGKRLKVVSPVSICTNCGCQTLAQGQTDELIKRTKALLKQHNNRDLYTKLH